MGEAFPSRQRPPSCSPRQTASQAEGVLDAVGTALKEQYADKEEDMASLEPAITDAHAPDETLDLDSKQRMWSLLERLLISLT